MINQRKLKNPNPLDFFNVRQLKVPSPHFECISISLDTYNLEHTITKWIEDNLRGRFYVGKITELDADNQFKKMIKIGFEEPKELSYFTLACPYLKYK